MCSSVYGNEVANRSRAGIKLTIKRSRGNRHYFHFIKKTNVGGPHSTVDSILASLPAAPGSILGIPKIFSDLDVVEIYQQRALLRQWTVQRA